MGIAETGTSTLESRAGLKRTEASESIAVSVSADDVAVLTNRETRFELRSNNVVDRVETNEGKQCVTVAAPDHASEAFCLSRTPRGETRKVLASLRQLTGTGGRAAFRDRSSSIAFRSSSSSARIC